MDKRAREDLRELDRIPFEDQVSPLMFDRRIEGVLRPDKMPSVLQEVAPPSPQRPVAQLEHKLDRVLFNPGVHWLRDSRSRVYNFDPYLQDIPPVTDFAFERLPGFVPSSSDTDITTLLHDHDKKFSGSTSSLSGMLCHIYFLMCGDRFVDLGTLSRDMQGEKRSFTPGQRMAASVVFNHKDGRYMIDSSAEKNDDAEKNILLWLGTLLEKFLTVPKEQFAGYLRSNTDVALPEKSTMRDAFRFSKSDKFIMRSQLDCRDPRLPGTGVFDIKTRACISIRLDLFNFEENSGYLIRKQYGRYESFEREYYDLIRSAFLKYQFQARIGNMDGVIVAYHNTKQMFGFQYVPLEEMDERLFGPGEGLGDRVFKGCVGIMENLAEEIVGCFPGKSVKATLETLEFSGVLNAWVEPLEWDEKEDGERPIKQIQVRTWSYLDSQITKPYEAYREWNQEWSVRWQIAHLIASQAEIRGELMEAQNRRSRAWAVPSGVDPEDLKEWYESLNFSGGEGGSEVPFDPEKFSDGVDETLEFFRRLAREGRLETERIRELEEGKPRHVLGQTCEEEGLEK
ncbi:hypothetical protein AGABI1DRAFT_59024 [Agaricus bisporus var. burnettii JB137-S8]|uniref:Pet127-domain-containing protein n=1 Tax=Agaricus bisporus var. burnettii (strain JB137-S8 / ATCC MYA-4627 / FGSC 10392) TaxID=597362 RepID=K5VY56_AGABU|nr:uncharacterized protein AGABI1DRAFT_59024 [Agaricus bisporus var. burnettii JB137-S8]EKM79419.1 hypothetical protein AGABI1DRAFT_59024 [Agaricus bisporus var. burnettii JB137-S8]